jgi:hypothetical protein
LAGLVKVVEDDLVHGGHAVAVAVGEPAEFFDLAMVVVIVRSPVGL